jgi:hypothetical protein
VERFAGLACALAAAACAVVIVVRSAVRGPRGGADPGAPPAVEVLPAAHPPYRVLAVSHLETPTGVRPWPNVLADIAGHNAAPRPVLVTPVPAERFPAWRSPADLVVLGSPDAALEAHARGLGAEVLALEPEGRSSREGQQQLAQRVAEWLRDRGRLASAHLYADRLDLVAAEDDRAELAGGFWGREEYPAGLGGRWTQEEARLQLERRGREGGLVVALSVRHPQRRGAARVEVGGRVMRSVSGPNGRWNVYVDVREVPGAVLPVRIVADSPFAPRDFGAAGDARTLGVLVHAAWLADRPVESEIDLGIAEDGRLELASGFWQRERFPDGRVGRWSQPEATLLLEREAGERGLVLDVSLEHPEGLTSGRVEVGGRAALPFRWENGSRREVLDVSHVPGRQVPVRFVVDSAFQARSAGDKRTLGLFVHGARLVNDPEAARADLAPGLSQDVDWPGVTRDLDVAAAGDEGPELLSGFGPREEWPDGSSGRWTFGRAVFRLPRTAAESELILDLSFQSPWNLTTGWIEVGGVRRQRFRSANGRQRLVLDVGDAPGQELEVTILVDRPFRRPGQGPAGREYGLFLHRVRLAHDPG